MDLSSWFPGCDDLAERAFNDVTRGMRAPAVRAIAAEVSKLRERNPSLLDFTATDFDLRLYPPSAALIAHLDAALHGPVSGLPPEPGIPEIRAAIRHTYARELGLGYPEGSVLVACGARASMFAAFATLVAVGDSVVFPVPSFEFESFTLLFRGEAQPVRTHAEHGFLPTIDDLAPHLKTARLLCLSNPSDETGTAYDASTLAPIAEAVAGENRRRRIVGDRPLLLIFDQSCWRTTHPPHAHVTPVALVPELARYTVLFDSMSRSWASAGTRIGWAVCPPWIRDRIALVIAQMGGWASLPVQRATAALLEDQDLAMRSLVLFREALQARVERLRTGLLSLGAEGLGVEVLECRAGPTVCARFALRGRKRKDGTPIATSEDTRRFLLSVAEIAVLPLSAMGLVRDDGWARLSVAATDVGGVDLAIQRLRSALRQIV